MLDAQRITEPLYGSGAAPEIAEFVCAVQVGRVPDDVIMNMGFVHMGSDDVKEGDQLEIRFGNRVGKYQILSVKETVRKENAQDMYQVLEEDAQTKAERSVGE